MKQILKWIAKRIAEVVLVTPFVWLFSYVFGYFENFDATDRFLVSLYASSMFPFISLYAVFSAILHTRHIRIEPKTAAVEAMYVYICCYVLVAFLFDANAIFGYGAVPVGVAGAVVVIFVQLLSRGAVLHRGHEP